MGVEFIGGVTASPGLLFPRSEVVSSKAHTLYLWINGTVCPNSHTWSRPGKTLDSRRRESVTRGSQDVPARTLPGAAVTRFLSLSSNRCQIEFLIKLKLMLYLEGVGSLS